MSDWRGGPVYLIHNTDEAQQFAKGQFDGLTRQDAEKQMQLELNDFWRGGKMVRLGSALEAQDWAISIASKVAA